MTPRIVAGKRAPLDPRVRFVHAGDPGAVARHAIVCKGAVYDSRRRLEHALYAAAVPGRVVVYKGTVDDLRRTAGAVEAGTVHHKLETAVCERKALYHRRLIHILTVHDPARLLGIDDDTVRLPGHAQQHDTRLHVNVVLVVGPVGDQYCVACGRSGDRGLNGSGIVWHLPRALTPVIQRRLRSLGVRVSRPVEHLVGHRDHKEIFDVGRKAPDGECLRSTRGSG